MQEETAVIGNEATSGAGTVNQARATAFQLELEMQQNLPLGIIGGVAAALVCAAIWAGVTVAIQYQIGWMAVGVGFVVGYVVQGLGRGLKPIFGLTGAVCSLLGCLLGNLLSTCWFVSVQETMAFSQVILTALTQPSILVQLFADTFSPMDIVFYGIAVYEGYRFSFRKLLPREIAALRAN